MIEKLRRNFIIVAMCSTFVVLAIIEGSLCMASYYNMVQHSETILDMLSENDASFPADLFRRQDPGTPPRETRPDTRDKYFGKNGFTQETPYETRFFSVRMNQSGEVLTVDTGRIAAVATGDASDYAKEVFNSGKTGGFYQKYRYRVTGKSGTYMIIFVDCTREWSNLIGLVKNGSLISVLGLSAVFLLVLFFSKKVFRPVEESVLRQKRFITDASHELKTPLTIVSANVEILEMENGSNQWTKSIRNQVERLTSLTNQLVTLSRLDEMNRRQDFSKFPLSDAVREVAEGFAAPARAQRKTFRTDIEEGISYFGDEKLLRQSISLLLDNALKYSDEEGQIDLSLKRRGKKIQLVLWNTVETMEKGNQEKLFERFYRPDSSRSSATGGSGIGLSIVKSTALLHGGRAEAFSDDGKSIRFTITL